LETKVAKNAFVFLKRMSKKGKTNKENFVGGLRKLELFEWTS
jgi:hypothetical protein